MRKLFSTFKKNSFHGNYSRKYLNFSFISVHLPLCQLYTIRKESRESTTNRPLTLINSCWMNCLAICAFSFLMSQHAEGRFYTANAWIHCKCLQGFTGSLQGNESAGISNLWVFVIFAGNLIYRSSMGIPCISSREIMY